MSRPTALVVGGGGREHALVRSLQGSQSKPRVVAAPGNAGTPDSVAVAVTDLEGQVALAREIDASLVVVGPEAPLVAGLADRLRADGRAVLGPSAAAAQLEGSKAFAKHMMDASGVPTARWQRFESAAPAEAFIDELGGACVVKADGLAAGKGVVVASSAAEAKDAVRSMLGGLHGAAGHSLVIEELLLGEELSVLALVSGTRVAVFAPAQDHKRIGEGDTGPNTGGMGAYSPAPRATASLLADVEARCLRPLVEHMDSIGNTFSGILYAGLMLTEAGPKVLEYNVRFGDPETQAILPRLAEDPYELFLSAAHGELEDRPIKASSQAALTVVLASAGYPQSSTHGVAINGLEAAEATGAHVYHAGTKRDGDVVRTAGGRVLAVTGLGDDLPAARALAYEGIGKISFEGMQLRRDIGHRALGPKGSS